uniref:Uncharacterized protein n=1 Tax=Cacopsylla melanoneura TaxID=428564 RepID=A0A8D9A3F9_9HEMI
MMMRLSHTGRCLDRNYRAGSVPTERQPPAAASYSSYHILVGWLRLVTHDLTRSAFVSVLVIRIGVVPVTARAQRVRVARIAGAQVLAMRRRSAGRGRTGSNPWVSLNRRLLLLSLGLSSQRVSVRIMSWG